MRYFFDELPLEPICKVDGLTFDFNIFADGEAEVSFNGDDDFKIDAIRLEATSRNRTQIDKNGRPCYEDRTLLVDPKIPELSGLFGRVSQALRDNRATEIYEALIEDEAERKAGDYHDHMYEQAKERRRMEAM